MNELDAKPDADIPAPPRPPLTRAWTRDGFVGALSVEQSFSYGPDFLEAVGPHLPRRAVLSRMAPRDEIDPHALPECIVTSDGGFRLSLSGRRSPMPFVLRNVEADELHFIQEGEVEFQTEVGTIAATRGDFIYVPRSIAYRFGPTGGSMRSLVLESRDRFEFVTPYPVGVINYERDMRYAEVAASSLAGDTTTLILKAWTGPDTVFKLGYDPLALHRHLAGKTPVWKIGIDQIQKLVSLPSGGPPYPFLGAGEGNLLLFNLGSRPIDYRPPVHLNADYDEIMLFIDGGAWGECSEPGTISWVPKGVVHHGVSANTPEPHRSWLLETRATLRWTEAGLTGSDPMETATYGVFEPRRDGD